MSLLGEDCKSVDVKETMAHAVPNRPTYFIEIRTHQDVSVRINTGALSIVIDAHVINLSENPETDFSISNNNARFACQSEVKCVLCEMAQRIEREK